MVEVVTKIPDLEAGPPNPSFLTLVLKTFSGLGGGIAGMLILLVIFLGASTILQPALDPAALGTGDATKNPLFIFIFMAMIFLTSLAGSILSSLFFTFVEHERYSRRSTALSQIFFLNLVIFIILAPIYLVLDSRNLMDLIGFLAGFHVVLSALASVMVLEVIGNIRYALVGIYGVIFSLLFSIGSIVLLYEFSGRNPTVVLFATLPIIWTTMGFVTVIVEMFYHWLYTLYGSDFLMSKTSFAADYGEPEEEEAPEAPDVEGADFLKR